MILPFKTKFDNGQPTWFVEKILDACDHGFIPVDESVLEIKKQECQRRGLIDPGRPLNFDKKLHTIRIDRHNRWRAGVDVHARVNNRTKDSYQFAPTFTCVSTQEIQIYVLLKDDSLHVTVDNRALTIAEAHVLARNDGFETLKDFKEYFKEGFEGKIIHFTSLRYRYE